MSDEYQDKLLDNLLNELGPVEPPTDLADQVMARIADNTQAARARHNNVPNRKGEPGMRKLMWGVAAMAAAALIIFSVRGFPRVDHGVDGTIGAAKRFNGQQLASQDVVLGDTSAQQFMQSEAFDRLMHDPAARQLLSNGSVRVALQNHDLVNYLATNAEARAALINHDLMNVFADSQATAVLSHAVNASTQAALTKNGVNANTQAAVANTAIAASAQASVTNASLNQVLVNASLINALANQNLWSALANADVRAALSNPNVGAALNSSAFINAIQHPGFYPALSAGLMDANLRQ